jgi:hypothetical protein
MKRLGAALAASTLAALWIACSGDTPSSPAEQRCTSADECPEPGYYHCGEATCIDGVCGIRLFQVSTSQRRGDCHINKCNDTGYGFTEVDPEDVYEDGDPCFVNFCDDEHALLRFREAGPAPGGAGFCDGVGRLVDCLTTEDCADPSLICSHVKNCVPASCDNREFDPSLGELGRDCGGPCDPCYIGSPCIVGEDCITNACGPAKTCVDDTCNDGRKNGNERDVDCGASCEPCKDGKGCSSWSDCESSVCWVGRCQPPTCFDGTKNGRETGFDCGGPDCHPCRDAL